MSIAIGKQSMRPGDYPECWCGKPLSRVQFKYCKPRHRTAVWVARRDLARYWTSARRRKYVLSRDGIREEDARSGESTPSKFRLQGAAPTNFESVTPTSEKQYGVVTLASHP